MTPMSGPLRVLYVEDDADLGRQVAEALEDGNFGDVSIRVVSDFVEAREEVENRRFDLLILDVYVGKPGPEGDPKGLDVQAHLSQVRFVPTIFYTALPEAVPATSSPFIRVVGKGRGGLTPLLTAAGDFVNSGLVELNRGISVLIDQAYLDYMDQFVGIHWHEFGALPDRRALAYLVTRHLARSLSGDAVDHLAEVLGASARSAQDAIANSAEEDLVHRMQYYVMPPICRDFLAGDIVQGAIGGRTGHWVILTPSCDMVAGREKADYVQLATSLPLSDFAEYQQWTTRHTESAKKALVALMSNNRHQGQPARYHYLPGVFGLPHLVVDFQQVTHISRSELTSMLESGTLHRLASLDSPYAEALLSRYVQYMMRVGTPVLDTTEALESLPPEKPE